MRMRAIAAMGPEGIPDGLSFSEWSTLQTPQAGQASREGGPSFLVNATPGVDVASFH